MASTAFGVALFIIGCKILQNVSSSGGMPLLMLVKAANGFTRHSKLATLLEIQNSLEFGKYDTHIYLY